MTKPNPFKYFNSSPEVIRLAVMMYVRFPLSLRNVEDLLHERGIDVSHETVRYWWNRFGPLFASQIKKRRIQTLRHSRWKWHLDEVFVKINGQNLRRSLESRWPSVQSLHTPGMLELLQDNRLRCKLNARCSSLVVESSFPIRPAC
jgi:hypothetical protein